MKKHYLLFACILCLTACKIGKTETKEENTTNELQQFVVFNAGDDQVNSYRIPSILCAKDGSLLVFCEARKESWKDKSRTDIVLKRSTDGGKSWSPMQNLTKGTDGAFMDPTPLLDKTNGRIFLFTNFWPSDDHSGKSNRAILVTSDDNGVTWTAPQEVTNKLLPKGFCSMGFGPGNGLQMEGKKYCNRLILPMRVADSEGKNGADVAIYSDDHGKTWKMGQPGSTDDEFQIAEANDDTLYYNARVPGARMIARSTDGGETWTEAVKEPALPGVSKGCQASVLRTGETLYFSGIQGVNETEEYDQRAKLTLYSSKDGGYIWDKGTLLCERAAGYSCMTVLPNGKLAIVFETADTPSFTRKSIEGTNPPKRPADWMRLDVIIY